MGQPVAIYCRVSTADQSCDRQERDLRAFAKRAGFEIVANGEMAAAGSTNIARHEVKPAHTKARWAHPTRRTSGCHPRRASRASA